MEGKQKCEGCKHWTKTEFGFRPTGQCERVSAAQMAWGAGAAVYSRTDPTIADAYRLQLALLTGADFGCTLWEASNG